MAHIAFCCRFVNEVLHALERKKDSPRRLPAEWSHGEIIILPLTHGKLFCKIIKGIESMRGIELFIIFSMTAFHLPVMSWSKRTNLFMLDSEFFQRFFKERRLLFLAVSQLISEHIQWRTGISLQHA